MGAVLYGVMINCNKLKSRISQLLFLEEVYLSDCPYMNNQIRLLYALYKAQYYHMLLQLFQ